jgi:hypothetical protein
LQGVPHQLARDALALVAGVHRERGDLDLVGLVVGADAECAHQFVADEGADAELAPAAQCVQRVRRRRRAAGGQPLRFLGMGQRQQRVQARRGLRLAGVEGLQVGGDAITRR